MSYDVCTDVCRFCQNLVKTSESGVFQCKFKRELTLCKDFKLAECYHGLDPLPHKFRGMSVLDYGYCETCECFFDFFKYEHDIDNAGHKDCNWRYVTEEELVHTVNDCVEDGCFTEDGEPRPEVEELMEWLDTRNIAEMIFASLWEHKVETSMDTAQAVWLHICESLPSDIDNSIEYSLASGEMVEAVVDISPAQIQAESDKVFAWLKTTSEPFDNWEYDGKEMRVYNGNDKPEVYKRDFLVKQIPDLAGGVS